MSYSTWADMLYSAEEFNHLYAKSNGFNTDINPNSRVRSEGESFMAFIDAGSDALLRDDPDFITGLI